MENISLSKLGNIISAIRREGVCILCHEEVSDIIMLGPARKMVAEKLNPLLTLQKALNYISIGQKRQLG